MNMKNVRRLADLIGSIPDEPIEGRCKNAGPYFSMEQYVYTDYDGAGYPCRSPSCIAGWACWLAAKDNGQALPSSIFNDAYHEQAKIFLEIESEAVTKELFAPVVDDGVCWLAGPHQEGHITAAHASAVLYNLAETGEVDWSIRSTSAPELFNTADSKPATCSI